jgi:hypothetical protein
VRRAWSVLLLVVLSACGGEDDLGRPVITARPVPTFSAETDVLHGLTVAIDPEGLTSSGEIRVLAGSEIMFMNEDTSPHQIASDVHSDHDGCEDLNLEVLEPYQRVTIVLYGPARTCSFHDHLEHDAWWFSGTIVVVEPSQPL